MIAVSHCSRSCVCPLSAWGTFALQEVFRLADALASFNPSLLLFLAAQLCESVERGPVDRVVVLELHVTANRLHELLGGNMLAQIFVELELFASKRVDEGCDELEEAPDIERCCKSIISKCWLSRNNAWLTVNYQSTSQPLGVVVLQNTQGLLCLTDRCVLA